MEEQFTKVFWRAGKLKNYIAEAVADLIPVPSQLELHGRCRCGVWLSPCFGALFVTDLVVGMEKLEFLDGLIRANRFTDSGTEPFFVAKRVSGH